MAAASQLACRAGPYIYITLAFHRSPLTQRCLRPRPGGPEVPQPPATVIACEGPARPGEPWAWGRARQQPALGSGPEAFCLPASHAGRRRRPPGQQPSQREGFQVHEVPHAPELEAELPRRASSSHHGRLTELQRAGRGVTGQASLGTAEAPSHCCLEYILCPKPAIQVPPAHSQLKSQSETFLRRSSFPPGSNGQRGSNSQSSSSQPFLDAPRRGIPVLGKPRFTSGGGAQGQGRGSGLTLLQVLEAPLLQQGHHFILKGEREEPH